MNINSTHRGKKKKGKTVISFDEEIVTKNTAGKLLNRPIDEPIYNEANNASLEFNKGHRKRELERTQNKGQTLRKTNEETLTNENSDEVLDSVTSRESSTGKSHKVSKQEVEVPTQKRKKKKKISKSSESKAAVKITEQNKEDTDTNHSPVKKKKRKKNEVLTQEVKQDTEPDQEHQNALENHEIKKEESIRAQKRRKHVKLLEEKKLKVELAAQQSALNYLSLWKHNRSEWRFEKLKQIWLQQNIFDTIKIPNEFWDTAVQYFCGAKGAIRKITLKKAIELIEKRGKYRGQKH
ncbi:hypothetical protein NQ317_000357 [Molorchus minor]|uniref:WKF domain-containing protein n=1 Tax=Molorchus minor TaxID=1323400 RepID=A0ABQ9JNM4_9CUCU|nr:hypothetical protein NQ317_000357 [Molorchus minor]